MLLLCGLFFAMSLTGYAITFWLPSIVRRIHGLGDFQVGLLSAIPWICAVIGMYALAWLTDRGSGRRPWVAIGFKCAASVFWPLTQHALDLKIAAAGIALINSLGNLGGFFGPAALGYTQQATGSVNGGLLGLSVISVIAAGTVLAVRARRADAPLPLST